MAIERKLLAGVSKGSPFTEGADSIALASSVALVEASSASFVFNNPGWASGSLLTVIMSQNGLTPSSSGFTASEGGWELTKDVAGGVIDFFGLQVYHRITGGSEPGSYTFTSVSKFRQGLCLEWTGVNVSNPINAVGDYRTYNHGGASTTDNFIPAVTNDFSNCMGVIFGCWSGVFSSGTMWDTATPSGWTYPQNDHPANTSSIGQVVLYKKLPDPGNTGIDNVVNLVGNFREKSERALARFSITPIEVDEVIVIDVDDISQAQTLDAVASITQVEDIDPADISQAQITGDVFFSETDEVILNLSDIAQIQTIDGAVITQNHIIVCDDIAQAQTSDGIIYEVEFVIDDIVQAQVLDGVIYGIIFALDDIVQAQDLDQAGLIVGIVYDVDDITQSQTVEPTDLPISIRRFTSAIANSGVQSLIIDVPSGPTDEDYMLAILSTDGSGETHTATGAWTIVEKDLDSGGHTLSVWERIVSGAEPANYNFTWTSNEKAAGVILLIRGGDNIAPLYAKEDFTGRSTTPIGLGLTPIIKNNLFLSINSHDQAGGKFYTITYPNELNNELNIGVGPQSGTAIQVGSKVIPDTSSISLQTWVMSKKDNWFTLDILLKPKLPPFEPFGIIQSQTLDQVVLSIIYTLSINELSQSQTLDSTDIISNNDDHQFFIDNLIQSQTLDATTIVVFGGGDKILLEDGTGGILNEDGSGVILLE